MVSEEETVALTGQLPAVRTARNSTVLTLTMCLVGTLAAVPGTAIAASPEPTAELVLPAEARAIPRATRILNAGDTGFLWAQEGDDRLLWTVYANGTTTALDQRLPAPVQYDFRGWWPSAPSFHPGWYGAGSDTVAVYSAEPSPRVTLLRGASNGRTVTLPEGRSYQGTFGDTILTRTDDLAYHLLRDGVERPVSGFPDGVTEAAVEDADARSVIVRYRLADPVDEWRKWGLIDVASGVFTRLPDRLDPFDAWEVSGFRLATESILRLRSGRSLLDVLDREDFSAPTHTVTTGHLNYQAAHGLVGASLLSVDPIATGNNIYRGQRLWAERVDGTRRPATVMNPAAHQIVQAPDGSALVAGAREYVEEGDLDWGIWRISPTPDGSVTRHRITSVQPVPAQIHGLALGSGILSTADNSTIYSPSDFLGTYRSTWLTTPTGGGVPAVERATRDALVGGRDGSCGTSDNPRCITMFADGTGHHGRANATYRDVTMLYANGSAETGPSIETKHFAPRLIDLSGRYAVIDGGTYSTQYIGEFRPGAAGVVLQNRSFVGAAVWGSTLWSGSAASGVVTATQLPTGTVLESFTTSNGCSATRLQAVGRWVYWACVDYTYSERGSGVWDRVAKRHLPAPARDVLLGDGYLVEQVNGGLRLVDLNGQRPARMLVDADDLGPGAAPRTAWTVDRFGGAVAYTDRWQQVHIVPTGIPASALSVIDSTVSGETDAWSGQWWLSKPAASWQFVVRDAAGTALRTLSGSSVRGLLRVAWDGRDSAGRPLADGAFAWTLTAQPADGVGPALTVAGPRLAPPPPPPPPAPAPPTATKKPSISGTLAVGSTVKAAPGTWSPAPTSYAYQWSANGTAIKSATGASLKVTPSMVGKRLTVTVTARRTGHPSGVATSPASAVVAKGKASKATKKPSVSGTPKVGRTVKALVGTWSPKVDSYRYEWRLNGKSDQGRDGEDAEAQVLDAQQEADRRGDRPQGGVRGRQVDQQGGDRTPLNQWLPRPR
ncbi:FlgD immunoglobulin-like domain containing protein [Micromonospora sp. NPDC003816]|uniref:FlgD immunoglobulin-like domain containing protein n=1 Tax=Micromonospora sp. NPDC003816 TaxID=3364224 RepID=UPI0036872B73